MAHPLFGSVQTECVRLPYMTLRRCLVGVLVKER